jgi:hypothetical protein
VTFEATDCSDNMTSGVVKYRRKADAPRSLPVIRPLALNLQEGRLYAQNATFELRFMIDNPPPEPPELKFGTEKVQLQFGGDEWKGILILAPNSMSPVRVSCGQAVPLVFELVQDSQVPLVRIEEPESTRPVKSRTITVKAFVEDAHLDRVTIEGRDMLHSEGTFWIAQDVELLAEGPNDFRVEAFDKANRSTSLRLRIVRDTLAPQLLAATDAVEVDRDGKRLLQSVLEFDEPVASIVIDGVNCAGKEPQPKIAITLPSGTGIWSAECLIHDLAGNSMTHAISIPRPVPKARPIELEGFQRVGDESDARGYPLSIRHVQTGIELRAFTVAEAVNPVYVSTALVTSQQFKRAGGDIPHTSVSGDDVDRWFLATNVGFSLPTVEEASLVTAQGFGAVAIGYGELLMRKTKSTRVPYLSANGTWSEFLQITQSSPKVGFRVVYRIR